MESLKKTKSPTSFIDKLKELKQLSDIRKVQLKPVEKESQKMEAVTDHSQEFKDEAVRKLVEGHRTYASLAKQLGIRVELLKQWRLDSGRKFYGKPQKRIKAKEKAKGKRPGHRRHTLAFKRKCVKKVVVDGRMYVDVGKEMDLHPNQISQWRKTHNFVFSELNTPAQAPMASPTETQPINNAMPVATARNLSPYPGLQEKYTNEFLAIQTKIEEVMTENNELKLDKDHLSRDRADLLIVNEALEKENAHFKKEHRILKQAAAIFANDVE